jgi:hypothetical protein
MIVIDVFIVALTHRRLWGWQQILDLNSYLRYAKFREIA